MADSDKDIIITPNRGLSGQPEIYFGGSGGVPIRMKMLDDSDGTLSWEGSAGQLFSVNNNLSSGTIFSMNDASGIPAIEVNVDGTVSVAGYTGNVGIGVTAPAAKLHVGGGVLMDGGVTFGGAVSGSTAQFSGLVGVGGGISAGGGVTFGGTLSGTTAAFSRLVTFSGGISAAGGITLGGSVNAVNGISAAGATLGTLVVNAGISASGGITFAGLVRITDTTASSSTTTGALTVAGGVGVGGAIYAGDNIVMANGKGINFAATSDPTIPAVAATGWFLRTATNVSDGDTVTIGSTVYTFKTALTPADYEVLISGVDAAGSLTNLRNAILGTGGSPGDYQVPAAHPTVTAEAINGSVLPLRAITAGTAGNSIALAETSTQLSVSAATLLGGRAAQGATSELLDDYEVGTWSPRWSSQTGAFASISMEIFEARYARVGKIVTVTAAFRTSRLSIGTGSGNLRLSGLPYNPAGTSGLTYSPGVCAWVGNQGAWASNTPQTVIASAGSPQLLLTGRSTVTGADSITQVSDMSESNNRNYVTLSVTYIVA